MTVDGILDFLKGFVPGYAAIENLVAPVFGSDVWDYGQCRANCSGGAGTWPAVIATCSTCVDGIMRPALVKLLPELAGAGCASAGGVAIAMTWEVISKALVEWLSNKGYTWLATKAIPVFGLICLIGDIANIIVLLITLKRVWSAASDAKAKFCVCP